jgi:hypothetical protein
LRCLAAVLLLATACASGIPQEGRAGWPWTGESLRPAAGDDLGARAAELLSQAIRFETVIPPGGERPLAQHLVAYARQEGLEARVIETPAGPGGSPRAAAWAVLPGRGGAGATFLLSPL